MDGPTAGSAGVGVIGAGVLIVLYIVPTLIGSIRKHPSVLAIFVVNVVFGWTFIGWIWAFIWALSDNKRRVQSVIVTTVQPPYPPQAFAPSVPILPAQLLALPDASPPYYDISQGPQPLRNKPCPKCGQPRLTGDEKAGGMWCAQCAARYEAMTIISPSTRKPGPPPRNRFCPNCGKQALTDAELQAGYWCGDCVAGEPPTS